MPQFLSRPVGPGDLAEWLSINVSSGGVPLANWDAVGPASSNQFVISGAPGARDRYAMAPLPADATAVVSVTLFAYCTSDYDHLMRLALRSAGADLLSATFSPREGGYDLFEISYPLAPGGLPWTVALWNAIQAGQDCVTAGLPEHNVNELFAAVDYQTATVDDPNPVLTLELDSDQPTVLDLGPSVTVLELPTASPTVLSLDD